MYHSTHVICFSILVSSYCYCWEVYYTGYGSSAGANTGIAGEGGVVAGVGIGTRTCVGVNNIRTRLHDALGACTGSNSATGAGLVILEPVLV